MEKWQHDKEFSFQILDAMCQKVQKNGRIGLGINGKGIIIIDESNNSGMRQFWTDTCCKDL
jgi:hypothetical protein